MMRVVMMREMSCRQVNEEVSRDMTGEADSIIARNCLSRSAFNALLAEIKLCLSSARGAADNTGVP